MADTLNQVADEFVGVVDTCFGLYLDCIEGFKKNCDFMLKAQASSLNSLSGSAIKSIADLDRVGFFIGKGEPTDPSNVVYHRCTQGEFKERNTPGGKNDSFIGRYCIVLLYEYWESEYRNRFANVLSVPREDLRNDLFGDLRYLRHAIIHNRGCASKDCESLKVIAAIREGTAISVTTEDLFHITRAIKAYVDDLLRSQTGRDPAYRTIWHVQ